MYATISFGSLVSTILLAINLNFKTLNNKSVNTKNQYFTSSEYNNDGNKVIVTLKLNPTEVLPYVILILDE